MSFLGWMGVCGALLLVMALSSAYLRRLPITTSVVYLLLGLGIGPAGLGWLRIDEREAAPWLEPLAEVAVIVSLFVGGLKLRLPWRDPAWAAAYRLAGPVMLACIVGVALAATDAADLTLSVVALSIVAHGVTAQPLLSWYERKLAREEGGAERAGNISGERSL